MKIISISEYRDRVNKEFIPFSDREIHLTDIYLGVRETNGNKHMIFNLAENCFRCMGSGKIENPWGYVDVSYPSVVYCTSCHGRGHGKEIKATKVNDGYYLIYNWKGYGEYEFFEVDGFNEFLIHWKSLYHKFTGREK